MISKDGNRKHLVTFNNIQSRYWVTFVVVRPIIMVIFVPIMIVMIMIDIVRKVIHRSFFKYSNAFSILITVYCFI